MNTPSAYKWSSAVGQVVSKCGTGVALAIALFGTPSASAFTGADADTLMNAFNTQFYVSVNSTSGYYQLNQSGGHTGFWTQAEMIEMAEDAYVRNPTASFSQTMTNLLNRFDSINTTNWSSDTFNDDVTWAVLANIRGYNNSGIALYLNCAEWNFNMMYARAWDTTYFGGGLFWTTAKASKNTCVNCPAAIAAYLLYQDTGNSTYLTEAQNIMGFVTNYLWNASTGAVYDNISTNGTVDKGSTTYNQGTFVGACNFLGYLSDAQLVADYTKNSMGKTNSNSGGYNIMPQPGTGTDDSGFNSICIRWISRYMTAQGKQTRYQPWLQTNAETAWDIRRTSDNLSWCQWQTNTPSGTMASWDCANSVTALQDITPQ